MYVLSSKRFEKNWSFLKFRIENRTYIGPASVKKKDTYIHTFTDTFIYIQGDNKYQNQSKLPALRGFKTKS